jgi:hypothetical protein
VINGASALSAASASQPTERPLHDGKPATTSAAQVERNGPAGLRVCGVVRSIRLFPNAASKDVRFQHGQGGHDLAPFVFRDRQDRVPAYLDEGRLKGVRPLVSRQQA